MGERERGVVVVDRGGSSGGERGVVVMDRGVVVVYRGVVVVDIEG